ncbi:MAG TPA: hypothetical protein VKS20_07880 [Candidatus Acidoferrales bacterium]|nr:hypothetical protein [Candidatus Acidoferrales bacterium]
MPLPEASRPFSFASAPPRSATVPPFFEGSSSFTAAIHHEAAKTARFAVESARENDSHSTTTDAEYARHMAALREFFNLQYAQFSHHLDQQLDVFCQQTASRLDSLSEQIIHRFCEELNTHAAQALNALMADWAEQNRALVDAECHHALDQFSARLQSLSAAHVESHRKEMQNLSLNLKSRLRGVAHALQDIGPASHHNRP